MQLCIMKRSVSSRVMTLVSVLTFRIADSLPRDHLLQKVHWLFLILVLLFCQSSLVLRCPHPLIACDMVALGTHQGIQTTLNAGSRVLTATKPLVLAYEDANRMDFGVEESFLAKVSATEVEITLLNKYTSSPSNLCTNTHSTKSRTGSVIMFQKSSSKPAIEDVLSLKFGTILQCKNVCGQLPIGRGECRRFLFEYGHL